MSSLFLGRAFRTALFLLIPALLGAQSVPAGFNDAVVVSGFNEPVGFTFDDNGRLYVWEKAGKVWIVENGVRRPTPLIDISPEVGNWRDHGCLGFALDPQFLANGRIYLFYAVDRHYLMNFGTPAYNPAANEYYNATIMRLARYTAIGPDFNTVDPASRKVLIGETKATGVALTHESHSTGSLVFATDGTLMVSTGDAASYSAVDVGSDPQTYFAQALADSILKPKENIGALRSQLVDCLNGKLLRIDPATGDGVPSNPFYDASDPRAPRSRVWALGFRNPYRFTKRPGTGSTNPALGDPGVFYVGDVGLSSYEEMDVCDMAGMNFGWPLFEGMEQQGGYWPARVPNLDAPNPLYGQGGCTKAYFDFQDLVVQETLTHPSGLPNPCASGQMIPPNVRTFTHSRPVIDWVHGNRSRCSAFNGQLAVHFDLDDPNSPVPGPRFGGNASVGAAFVAGTGWPQGYQGSYFIADYASAWIRRVTMDHHDKAMQVYNFATNMGAIVCLKEGPDGALWYVRYETGQIRKVAPLGFTNLPPVAVVGQSVLYGTTPLTVQFTGSNSTDPENGPLSYLWDFGDGTTSTAADPQHTFTAPPGVPMAFTVQLTVRDDQNQPNSTTLLVNVNNTPPNVQITSFPNGQLYPVGVDTVFTLAASVSDAESPNGQLTYAWQTVLHHNIHVHPEPIDNAVSTTTLISGVGCYDDPFHYEVHLTVTDPGGLSTTVTHQLLPDCGRIAPTPVIKASAMQGMVPMTVTLDGLGSVDNGTIVSYAWEFDDGTTASGATVQKVFSETGDNRVWLTVTDDDGLSATALAVIKLFALGPPQCVGPAGSVLREYWTGINGTAINQLLNDPRYPDSPTGTTYPTTIAGPVNFANNYGTRIRGYIIPTASGTYTFNTTSDDVAYFYLSPNAEPLLKELRCEVPGWTGDTEYNKYPSQESVPLQLVAGQHYYFEVLHKEGSGGDHVTVRWKGPGMANWTAIGGSNVARWQPCGPNLRMRAVLQGPYDAATGLMRDDLRAKGLLPLQEPFTALGFTQAGGGGGETTTPGLLAATGKNAVVDWVLVELRNGSSQSTVVATKAALLQRDGDLMDASGNPLLVFSVPPGNYFVSLRHRNHLGVMHPIWANISSAGPFMDFSDPRTIVYGMECRVPLRPDRSALRAGDATHDGVLKYTGTNNDRDPILQLTGSLVPTTVVGGYHVEDVNLDGNVKYTGPNNDRELILFNLGGSDPVRMVFSNLP